MPEFKLDTETGLLVGVTSSVIGVYALIMLGAIAGVTDALAACGGWPTCDGRLLVAPNDPMFIGWAHRVTAVAVGLLLLSTVITAWLADVSRRVTFAITSATCIYPLQLGVGATVVLFGPGASRSLIHLAFAMVIFSSLVIALAWLLEEYYPVKHQIRGAARTPAQADGPSNRSGWQTTARAYLELTKPKLMWLLSLVAVAGMALAGGRALQITTAIATILGGVLAIGAAGTFNHVIERDVDRRMARTADRPLATDHVPVRNALAFGVALGLASVSVFAFFVNLVAAALGLAAIVFYSVIYTVILKPNTVQNTVIGGFAGALPALIGWSAVTGRIGLPAVLLAGVIFTWTPAHFYNLAMAYREDYARGGFPMLPVVRGDAVARKHILGYTAVTMLMVATLAVTSPLDWLFAVGGIVAGAGFLLAIVRLHRSHTQATALRTFHASNAYLGMLLLLVTVDAIVF